MKTFLRTTTILAIAAIIAFASSTAPACTGITIKPKDGSVIFARTLEFAADLKSNVIVVPRGTEYVGTAPGNKPGLRWKTKYGTVGANAFDLPVVVDGLNEKGLHVGLFYFPGFAKYQEVKADDLGKALAPWEIGSYLLGTCPDLKEAVAVAKSVLVGEVVQKDMGFVPPVHLIVTVNGARIVRRLTGVGRSTEKRGAHNPIRGFVAKTCDGKFVTSPTIREEYECTTTWTNGPKSVAWC
jgi:choloylglycine hydrolase